MLDLVVRGGRVVAPHGVGHWDVGILGEKIVAVAEPGILSQDAVRVVDATGKIVVPGGIDPHLHCGWPLFDLQGAPAGFSAGPAQVSRAALFGGTTTVVDFARWIPGESLRSSIEKRDEDWHGKCLCDYSYHIMLRGDVPPQVIDQVPETIQAGFPSIKMFTNDVVPGRRGRKVGFGLIWEVLQHTSRHGGIAAIHAEDDDIVMHMYEKLVREGRVDYKYIPLVHSALAEELAFARVIRLAENVDGAALYMMHVSSAAALRMIAESRGRGFPIYGETLPHYALHTADAYLRPNGQIYHTYPSLKSKEDCQALWDGMSTGTISTLATDEMCTTLDEKVRGTRIDNITGGHAGVEPRMGVFYTEAVVRRGFSLDRFVDLTSTNAAKILGMYPRKGAIATGSDADITIIDPTVDRCLQREDLHETDYTPWEGWVVSAWPAVTILRGKVAVEDGRLLTEFGNGKCIQGKLSRAMLAGPSC